MKIQISKNDSASSQNTDKFITVFGGARLTAASVRIFSGKDASFVIFFLLTTTTETVWKTLEDLPQQRFTRTSERLSPFFLAQRAFPHSTFVFPRQRPSIAYGQLQLFFFLFFFSIQPWLFPGEGKSVANASDFLPHEVKGK